MFLRFLDDNKKGERQEDKSVVRLEILVLGEETQSFYPASPMRELSEERRADASHHRCQNAFN